MKYNRQNNSLINLAIMIARNVPFDELPDDLQDDLDMNGIDWPNDAINVLYGYLKEVATEYIDSIPPLVIPRHED